MASILLSLKAVNSKVLTLVTTGLTKRNFLSLSATTLDVGMQRPPQTTFQIEEEMRSQYLLAYEPNNQQADGSYRKIEIQLVNPEMVKQKVKITHRQGYFARNAAKK